MPAEVGFGEEDVIRAAFEERVRGLFLVLADALATGEPERASLERFRRALRSAKKARDLALQAAAEERGAVA